MMNAGGSPLHSRSVEPTPDPTNRPPKKSKNTCTACRTRKVRCDGRRDVCTNCERLGFACSFQDPSAGGADGEAGISSFSLPRRRVRLACINCHSRKARCSGTTPKCDRCSAQGIECVYRPSKRSGTLSSGHNFAHGASDSEHDSVGSDGQYKRFRHDQASDHAHSSPSGRPGAEGSNSGTFGHDASLSPEEPLVLRSFENFFRHVHHIPSLSFLHRASLMHRYHAGMMDKALLLAVIGITSLFTNLGPGVREYGVKCVDQAELMVLKDLASPSTIKTQTLALVIKHRILSRRFASAFMLMATAARFAMALRLNYENTALCFLAQESRRRLMWALSSIDSTISAGYEDFQLCPTEAIHIQLPCNERNFEFDLPQVTERLDSMPQGSYPDDVGSLALHIRLQSMKHKIFQFARKCISLPEQSLPEIPRVVAAFGRDLQEFIGKLPSSFTFSENNLRLRAYSPRLCIFITIHVCYHQCYLDLYRIVLSGMAEALPRSSIERLDPNVVAYCERQCFDHALAMAEVFRIVLALDGGLPVADVDLAVCAYQCARVLYYANRINHRDFTLTTEQVVEHAHLCLRIVQCANHLPMGASVQSDLETLMSRGMSGNTTPSQPGSPVTNGMPTSVGGYHSSRHSLVRQMGIVDDIGIMSLPILSTPPSGPTPSIHGPLSRGSSQDTPQLHHTPAPQVALSDTSMTSPTRLTTFPDIPFGSHLPKAAAAPPISQPTGLDAFEGAMDGFDFSSEPGGTQGLESLSWFSSDWLNAEFPHQAPG